MLPEKIIAEALEIAMSTGADFAELFSENLLKQLLISNDGSEVLCAMAISRCEDGLKIRVEYLN